MSAQNDELQSFLGDQPRASAWRELRLALADRLKNLRKTQAANHDADDQIRLAREIEHLEAQVETLRIEEAVAQFVEDSVRVSIASRTMEDEE